LIRIRAEEHSKYAFLLCALCGEILKEDLLGTIGTERLARRAVQRAREDRLLTEKKTSCGKFVRLTKAGCDELFKIPPLRAHYEAVSKKHTFSQDGKTLARRKAMARSVLTFAAQGIPVSGMRLVFDRRPGRKKAPAGVHDTVLNPLTGTELFTGLAHVYVTYEEKQDFFAGEIGSFTEYAKRTAFSSAGFFPSNIVKRHRLQERSTAGNMNATRVKGQLFGGGISCSIYYMEKGPVDTPVQNELRYAEYMLDVYEKIYGPAALKALTAYERKGRAAIIGGDPGAACAFVLDERARRLRNSISAKNVLPAIYSQVHYLPFADCDPQILLDPAREEDMIRRIYLPEELRRAREMGAGRHIKAVIGLGGRQMLSMPLFSLELVKISDSISGILELGEPLHIVCPQNIEEPVRRIYENYKDAHIEVLKED